MHRLVLSLFAITLGSAAFAQLSATGPFTGSLVESFETFPEGSNINGVFIMGGGATTQGNAPVTSSERSFNGSRSLRDTLPPSSGGFLGFTFTAPVSRFGGYFAHDLFEASPTGAVSFTFYDSSNAVIGTPVANIPIDSTMHWLGWSSTVGIKRVVFAGDFQNIPFVDFIQADPVPEPASIAAVGFGLAAMLRKRRR